MASPAQPSLLIRFGEFELIAATGEVRKAGIPLKIHPQPFRVLLLLAERSGQIVTREEIRRCLWGDNTYVDFEGGINFCVKQIRDVLADDAENPRYLQTIPRRGYRFIASVNLIDPVKHPLLLVPPAGTSVTAERCPDLKLLGCDETELERSSGLAAVAEKPARTNYRRLTLIGCVIVLVLATLTFGWLRGKRATPVLPSEPIERQLTANPPEDYVFTAAISPDGKFLAYVDQTGLLVRSVSTGEIRPISLPADFPASQIWEMRWFPDGGKLLLTRRASVSEETSLWTLAVLGEAVPQRLRPETSAAAISPDGKSLVFKSGALHQAKEIWVSGLNGDSPRRLAPVEEGQGFGSPVWSPDGKWIAYVLLKRNRSGGANTSLQIQPAAGGPSKTILTESSLPSSSTINCYGFDCVCWTSDWNLVFALAEPSAFPGGELRWSLWKIHANPNQAAPVPKPVRLAQWPEFGPSSITASADGKTLAFVKGRNQQDTYVAELTNGPQPLKAPRRLTLDNHDSIPEAWAHDNQGLLFISNRNGKWELFRQRLNNGVPEKLVSSETGELGSGNGLSPDGLWLLYWELPRSDTPAAPSSRRLMRQPAAGGPPEKVLELPFAPASDSDFACPQNSASPCVLSAREGEKLVFNSLDPVRGKGDLLGKIAVDDHWSVGWALSPDGSQLAVVDHSHKNRIEILNLLNRVWREISVEPGWGDFQALAWSADSNDFFVTTFLPESFNLIRVDLSGKAKLLLNNGQKQWMTRPRASSDGKYLAFQVQSSDTNVWLLENF